ncbi:neuronal acetylcholine receptor subunit beta-2-like [Mytilus californianus]|uniref:neuronal acetylcholine receptor subunit beta-2-like n=1 Tax=Mytilus californianus TaxID=6549 RepID=UPI0022460EF1|nr:neuronal acetylcholine receptor subunit beta-2-like [Mytilus californianus]
MFISFFNVLLLILFVEINGQSGSDVTNLLTALFTTNSYDKRVRPKSDQTTATTVDLDLYLVGINDIDEIEGKLTTTAFLHLGWIDEFLVWSPPSYNGVGYFYIPQSDIWKPDITLENGFSKLKELGNSFINAAVAMDGQVFWKPFEVFETKCSLDTKYFPFDKQTCKLSFVVWSSGIEDVNVTLWNNGINLDYYEENSEWTVLSTAHIEASDAAESRVVFSLNIERNSAYYIMNIILPVILLSFLNVLTFALPADSGEKISQCITVFLSFAVFLTIVNAELPKTSGSIVGYYLIFQLAMGTIVITITVLQLRLHHRKDPVPPSVIKIIKCLPFNRIAAVNSTDKNKVEIIQVKNTEPDNDDCETETTWSDVVSSIDFVMFWTALGIVMTATIVVLTILSTR